MKVDMPSKSQPEGRASKTLYRVMLVLSLLGVAILIAGFALLDRQTWAVSRRLSEALDGARSVTLVEYENNLEISRRSASPDEISQLRNMTRNWWRPFVPTSGYLCFEVHHRIEIVKADGAESNAAFSFLCEQFVIENESTPVPLPHYLKELFAAFFTSAGMAPKTYDEYRDIKK